MTQTRLAVLNLSCTSEKKKLSQLETLQSTIHLPFVATPGSSRSLNLWIPNWLVTSQPPVIINQSNHWPPCAVPCCETPINQPLESTRCSGESPTVFGNKWLPKGDQKAGEWLPVSLKLMANKGLVNDWTMFLAQNVVEKRRLSCLTK